MVNFQLVPTYTVLALLVLLTQSLKTQLNQKSTLSARIQPEFLKVSLLLVVFALNSSNVFVGIKTGSSTLNNGLLWLFLLFYLTNSKAYNFSSLSSQFFFLVFVGIVCVTLNRDLLNEVVILLELQNIALYLFLVLGLLSSGHPKNGLRSQSVEGGSVRYGSFGSSLSYLINFFFFMFFLGVLTFVNYFFFYFFLGGLTSYSDLKELPLYYSCTPSSIFFFLTMLALKTGGVPAHL